MDELVLTGGDKVACGDDTLSVLRSCRVFGRCRTWRCVASCSAPLQLAHISRPSS